MISSHINHLLISDIYTIKLQENVKLIHINDIFDIQSFSLDGIWIYGYSSDLVISIIKTIRSTNHMWNVPIFVGNCLNIDIDYCDGKCESFDEYISMHSRFSDTVISNISIIIKEMRPLIYATTRGINVIKYTPTENEDNIIYPLLDMFSIYNAYGWILNSIKNGFISASKKILGSCRLCPSCFGSRFNFNEHCMSCNSKSITKINLIHCFICNHVSPESEMGTGDNIKCPACKGKLIHRGVDYQHILDTYNCYECNNKSQDILISIKCLGCKVDHNPSELIRYDYHYYMINIPTVTDYLD